MTGTYRNEYRETLIVKLSRKDGREITQADIETVRESTPNPCLTVLTRDFNESRKPESVWMHIEDLAQNHTETRIAYLELLDSIHKLGNYVASEPHLEVLR